VARRAAWPEDALLKRAVVSALATLLILLSVAVPLLERADFSTGTTIESEHDPTRCPRPHDHTICTQVAANHSAPATRPEGHGASLGYRISPPADVRIVSAARRTLQPPARAPPTA